MALTSKNNYETGPNSNSQGDVLIHPELGGLRVRGTYWYVLEIFGMLVNSKPNNETKHYMMLTSQCTHETGIKIMLPS